MDKIIKIFDGIHFNNELFSVLVFGFCALLIVRLLNEAHRNQVLDWSDIITQSGPSNKVALSKVIQLVGSFTATWIVIHITLFGNMSYDIFAIYLAFIGGTEGWSKYLSHKKDIFLTEKTYKSEE